MMNGLIVYHRFKLKIIRNAKLLSSALQQLGRVYNLTKKLLERLKEVNYNLILENL